MKKYLFTLMVAAATGIGAFMAYGQPDTDVYVPPFLEENIEVKPGGDDESNLGVTCFCKTDPNIAVCSAKATGPKCGMDRCIDSDSNCR